MTSRKAVDRAFKVTKFIFKGDGMKRCMRRKESYFISGHTCYMMRNYCAILVIIIKEVTQIIEFVTTVTIVATIAPWCYDRCDYCATVVKLVTAVTCM